MQPCAVCGGGSVNQAGYCLNCGTLRGVPPAPHSYPPQPAQPEAPPPATNRGRSYLVPLVALGSTLAVLVAAIGVVLVARTAGSGDTDRVTADPSPSPTPSASVTQRGSAPPSIDPCVVGSWEVESHEEDIALPAPFGTARFVGVGPGARVELREDGLGAIHYGDGTDFEGEVSGITVTLTFTGTITYHYRALDGAVSFTDVNADGLVTLSAPGIEPKEEELAGNIDPANYRCGGDTLTQQTNLYTVQMARL
ncbi:hypothetical protein [Micromonospora sp. LOL_023]|uniref:hypothetical protein n=1 Tax=Micromonospora sp. LOL_023 TaxID=3345418 RepID=UPI003A895258